MNDPREKRRIQVDDMIHNITISLDKIREKAQDPNISNEELKRYVMVLIGLNQILTGACDLDY